MNTLIRLMLDAPRTETGGLSYHVRVEGGADLGRMMAPLTEGARMLQMLGLADDDDLLTTRRVGKDYDDWKPVKVRVAAKLTVTERSGNGLALEKFRPFKKFGEARDA